MQLPAAVLPVTGTDAPFFPAAFASSLKTQTVAALTGPLRIEPAMAPEGATDVVDSEVPPPPQPETNRLSNATDEAIAD